jgi:hypothetical protein
MGERTEGPPGSRSTVVGVASLPVGQFDIGFCKLQGIPVLRTGDMAYGMLFRRVWYCGWPGMYQPFRYKFI